MIIISFGFNVSDDYLKTNIKGKTDALVCVGGGGGARGGGY